MRRGLLAVVLAVACRPPVLPPVPDPPSPPVDLVPAQARADLLRAQLLLDAGDAEQAARIAGRAARLDPTAAAPWMWVARARTALGDTAGADAAVEQAIRREPHAVAPRVWRLAHGSADPTADLDTLAGIAPSTWGAYLPAIARAAQAVGHAEVAALAHTEARGRVYGAGPTELEQLLPVLAAGEGGLALVVAALRLHAAGAATPEAEAWARVAVSATVEGSAAWSPLPQEWRDPLPADAERAPVGYQRAPDDDRGWRAALAGRRTDAQDLLTAAWRSHPGHPTLQEQLWLLQRSAAR